MKRFSIVCGLILAATLAPINAIAATFSQIIVYGDSLSDLGRASALTGGAAPPYSLLTGGKFSNGQLWIEYLATSLGIATNPNTNFAVGGATTGTNNTIFAPLGGIQTQVSTTSIGDSNALYVIWGGANDYVGDGIQNPTGPISNLNAEINTLIGRGAKNILVPNLSNLGDLPSKRILPGSVPSDLNTLTQDHNIALSLSLNNLRLANPGVNLTLLDVNSLFNQVVANPSSFGFTNITDGCLLVGCTNPDSYLFWDTIHPTQAGHQLIGNLAFNAVTPAVPEPATLLGSLVAGGSIIAFKRKLKSSKLKSNKTIKST
jgi:thermolabile hemolysin